MKKTWIVLILAILALFTIPSVIEAQERHELGCRSDLLLESEKFVIGEMGKTERNNDAPHVADYNNTAGTSAKSPYCASGQYWTYFEAAKKLGLNIKEIPIPKTALAYNIFLHGKKHGERTEYIAKRHDFINWKIPKKINGHVERIKSVLEGGWVETCAFNTSPNKGDQREGDINTVKRRNIYHPLQRMQIIGLTGFEART